MRQLRHGQRRRAVAAVLAGALAAAVAAGGATASGAAANRATRSPSIADAGLTVRPRLAKPGGKLSPRLAALAASALDGATARQLASALSVAPSGSVSLAARAGGRYLVNARLRAVDGASLTALRAAGARIVATDRALGVVTASVTPRALDTIAALTAVESVDEVLTPLVARSAPHTTAATTASTTSGAIHAACSPTISEGDTQLDAALARGNWGVDGSGVTVGVLSDSYDKNAGAVKHASNDVASGDLPGPGNPCGHSAPVVVQADAPSGTDEGRAMLQVVHDLAPGASLAFATAYNGEIDYANEIRKLHDVNGANVIVDDVTYPDEPFFQDGPIAAAVDDVHAAGVQYVAAAGDDNLVIGGNDVSSYETPAFRATTCPASLPSFAGPFCHNFDPSGGDDNGDDVTVSPGGSFTLDLQWAEPWNGVVTDYDVYLVDNATGTVVGSSAASNTQSQRPAEVFQWTNLTGLTKTLSIVVNQYEGATPRFKFDLLNTQGVTGVQYDQSAGGDIVGPAIFGHGAAAAATTVGVVPYNDSASVESTSDRGPVTQYFGPVSGTTPAAPLASALVLAKPDVAATDGGRTTFYSQQVSNVWRWYGTGEAAAHVAAIDALVSQHTPSFSPDDIAFVLDKTARPVANAGTDAAGAGLVDANAAVDSVVFTANVDDAGLANTIAAAAYYHVDPQALPATGVAALQYILGLDPDLQPSPIPPPDNDGPHPLRARYSQADAAGVVNFANFFSLTGDQAHYLALVFMIYIWVILGTPGP